MERIVQNVGVDDDVTAATVVVAVCRHLHHQLQEEVVRVEHLSNVWLQRWSTYSIHQDCQNEEKRGGAEAHRLVVIASSPGVLRERVFFVPVKKDPEAVTANAR